MLVGSKQLKARVVNDDNEFKDQQKILTQQVLTKYNHNKLNDVTNNIIGSKSIETNQTINQ